MYSHCGGYQLASVLREWWWKLQRDWEVGHGWSNVYGIIYFLIYLPLFKIFNKVNIMCQFLVTPTSVKGHASNNIFIQIPHGLQWTRLLLTCPLNLIVLISLGNCSWINPISLIFESAPVTEGGEDGFGRNQRLG